MNPLYQHAGWMTLVIAFGLLALSAWVGSRREKKAKVKRASAQTPVVMDDARWALVNEWMDKGMMRNAFILSHGSVCAPGAEVKVRGVAKREGVQVQQMWWCTGCGDIMPEQFNIVPQPRTQF